MAKKAIKRHKGAIRGQVLSVAIGLLLVLNGFLVYLLLNRVLTSSPTARAEIRKTIRVEVLNGCGDRGVAWKMARYLRQNGFDVMNVSNAESFNIYRSMVVDRVGNLAIAERVAQAIELNPENIIQQKNEYSVWDITIIIGRDYRKLKPFKMGKLY